MKRTYTSLSMATLSLCLFILAIFSSCSTRQDYTNAIPGDAKGVFSVNLQVLAQKAGIQEAENQAAMDKLTEALKTGLSSDLQQQIENLMENPENLGIDYAAPVYFFQADRTGMVAKMSDHKQLENFLETTRQDELFIGPQQADGYAYAYNEKLFIAFNETTLLAFAAPSSMDIGQMNNDAKQLLAQTEENSIRQQNFFNELQTRQGDISMAISAESLHKLVPQTNMPGGTDLKDLIAIYSLDFGSGRIEMKGNLYTEDKTLKAFIEEQASATPRPIEGKYLTYFPESTLMLMAMNVDGEKLYQLMQNEETVSKQITPGQSALLHTLLGAFRNDITIGFTNLSASGAPSFVAYAETSDENILQSLYEQMNAQGLTEELQMERMDNGDYQLHISPINLFIGIRGTDLFLTSDPLQYDRIAQKAEPSVLEADFADELKGKHIAFIANAESLFDLPLVKMAIGFLSPERQTYVKMAQNISYISMGADTEYGQISIVLKDKNANALKQVVDFIKTFIGI